jgi:hypothetical protein
MKKSLAVLGVLVLLTGTLLVAQTGRKMSPDGAAAAEVQGAWAATGRGFTLGRGQYSGGKWIELTFGRPLKRGRDLWGSGANYGKDALVGGQMPIWRAGADVATQLKTEVPLTINGKTLAPGTYTLFIDLKEDDWTLVVSTWPAQTTYDANNKAALWGSYGYTPDKDVVRATMKLETMAHSFEELSWQLLDVTDTSATLSIVWDKVLASVPMTIGH